MVLARKPVGRALVVVGRRVVIAHTAIGWTVVARMLYWFSEFGGTDPMVQYLQQARFSLAVVGAACNNRGTGVASRRAATAR